MNADARALLGRLAATIGALVAVLGVVAAAPFLVVAAGAVTSVAGAALVFENNVDIHQTGIARTLPTAPGGLLATGSRVQVDMHLNESDGRYAMAWPGTITDIGSIPAPYIALTDVRFNLGGNSNKTSDNLIFLGPGVVIRPA